MSRSSELEKLQCQNVPEIADNLFSKKKRLGGLFLKKMSWKLKLAIMSQKTYFAKMSWKPDFGRMQKCPGNCGKPFAKTCRGSGFEKMFRKLQFAETSRKTYFGKNRNCNNVKENLYRKNIAVI